MNDQTTPKTLDDFFYDTIYEKKIVDIIRLLYDDQWPIKEVKDYFHQVMLEVIGEDLPLDTEPNTGQRIHNKVKQEQRQRLEKLMGMETHD